LEEKKAGIRSKDRVQRIRSIGEKLVRKTKRGCFLGLREKRRGAVKG